MDTIEIRLQALITRREGMLQANRSREGVGYAPAYHEDSFASLEHDMLALCPLPEITATPCPRCEANAELHRRCPEHQPEESPASDEVKHLTAEVEEWRRTTENLNAEISGYVEQRDAALAEVKRLTTTVAALHREIDALETQIAEAEGLEQGEEAPAGDAATAQGDGDPAAPSPAGPCPGDDRPAWRQEAGELLSAMTPGTNAGRIAQVLNAHLAEDAAREARHRKLREEAWVVLKKFDKCNLRPWHIKALRAALEEDEDVHRD